MEEHDEQDQEEIITPIMQTAITAHEMFTALIAAGFTPPEAIQIIIGMLTVRSGE